MALKLHGESRSADDFQLHGNPDKPISNKGQSLVTEIKSKNSIGGYLGWPNPTRELNRQLLAVPIMTKAFIAVGKKKFSQRDLKIALGKLQSEDHEDESTDDTATPAGYKDQESGTKKGLEGPYKQTMQRAIESYIMAEDRGHLLAAVLYHVDVELQKYFELAPTDRRQEGDDAIYKDYAENFHKQEIPQQYRYALSSIPPGLSNNNSDYGETRYERYNRIFQFFRSVLNSHRPTKIERFWGAKGDTGPGPKNWQPKWWYDADTVKDIAPKRTYNDIPCKFKLATEEHDGVREHIRTGLEDGKVKKFSYKTPIPHPGTQNEITAWRNDVRSKLKLKALDMEIHQIIMAAADNDGDPLESAAIYGGEEAAWTRDQVCKWLILKKAARAIFWISILPKTEPTTERCDINNSGGHSTLDDIGEDVDFTLSKNGKRRRQRDDEEDTEDGLEGPKKNLKTENIEEDEEDDTGKEDKGTENEEDVDVK